MIHVMPSARDVMPMAFLPSTPDNIWPLTTRGPYPPPVRPLLKDANKPNPVIFCHEYLNFLLKQIKINMLKQMSKIQLIENYIMV